MFVFLLPLAILEHFFWKRHFMYKKKKSNNDSNSDIETLNPSMIDKNEDCASLDLTTSETDLESISTNATTSDSLLVEEENGTVNWLSKKGDLPYPIIVHVFFSGIAWAGNLLLWVIALSYVV